MNAWISPSEAVHPVPLIAVDAPHLERLATSVGDTAYRWCVANAFEGKPGQWLALPAGDGTLAAVLAGCDATDPLHALAHLPHQLPNGHAYRLDPRGPALDEEQVALGWALGAYRFDRYRDGRKPARLVVEPAVADRVRAMAMAICHVRDLVNTPTEDLGPAELAGEVKALAERHGATYREWVGNDLLGDGFRLIHAVGRASHRAPRLAMLQAGPADAPGLVLVGKGVCFDTGGLDIKPASSMLLMKKDMGGAANVLGLALMIMDAKLKVDLRVLVPVVENSISANAFRPGDIYRSRKGLTVQIDNTDAEGRLILADALAYADEEEADLIVDMATLTGAARVALGPDLPPFFTDDDDLAHDLTEASLSVDDPMWRMPLYMGYDKDVSARIADLTNAPSGGMAGSITAALFLKRFVTRNRRWVHFDIYAWAQAERPHSPVGGEAQAIRALYHHLRKATA